MELEKLEIMKEKGKELQREVRQRTIGYITAGFGLVAGLAWNDAIRSSIEYFLPADGRESIWAKFIYAFVITLVLIIVTVYLLKIFASKEKNENK
ncbi:MAG TPA: hypothetical protein ENN31_01795 [Candidatus Vogelbacteria bacterium]|nr:hypothetical protein [Candidatus Vogelbacteria bacterium]